MHTPAHLILAAAVLARPTDGAAEAAATRRRNLAALGGALAPDVSVALLAVWSRWGLGHSWREVFEEDYRSALWQGVFAVDNSIPLWGALTALALALGRPALAAFGAAGLLHLATDLPLHHSDARPHFQPLSDWVFRSPVSYWNPARHGDLVALAEAGLCVALAALLLRRFRSAPARGLVLAGLGLGLLPALA